jgi:hypothetical protein
MATATELNRLKWGGQPGAGHYEVWYLTLHDPQSGAAFWVRYTLHDPPPSGGESEAALWAVSFEPDDGGLQLRDVYPLARFRDASSSAGFAVELGPGRIDMRGARGEVGEGERRIAWDLRFDWSRGRYAVREAPGEQGHVFGRRHADRWAWAHCARLEGAEWAAFDGISGQVRKLGLLLPPATPLHLALEGRGFLLDGARAIWTPKSEFELGRWAFEAEQGDQKLTGQVTATPESFVSVEYADPTGGRAYCNHSERADMRLELFERRAGAWQRELVLESHGQAAFEIASRERDPRVPRTLDLAEARVCRGRG